MTFRQPFANPVFIDSRVVTEDYHETWRNRRPNVIPRGLSLPLIVQFAWVMDAGPAGGDSYTCEFGGDWRFLSVRDCVGRLL